MVLSSCDSLAVINRRCDSASPLPVAFTKCCRQQMTTLNVLLLFSLGHRPQETPPVTLPQLSQKCSGVRCFVRKRCTLTSVFTRVASRLQVAHPSCHCLNEPRWGIARFGRGPTIRERAPSQPCPPCVTQAATSPPVPVDLSLFCLWEASLACAVRHAV